ncbi:MAG: ornithine cyclodeaminase family protein [Candidatus Eremiobacteraeota bacterium]|nr:ornithine cyclodeaminase family protein [Candidatus Eremiobacteraeota bacterium]
MKNREKQILFLSLEDVVACGGADVELAAADMERGFTLLHQGKIVNPMKTTLRAHSHHHEHNIGLVNFLPAYVDLGEEEIITCKLLGAMPSNADIGLPRATGLIALFDTVTKSPIAILDAQVISATRTGGVSLIATRRLASPDTEEIGLVGAGVNMRTQLLGIHKGLPSLKRVRVYSRGDTKNLFAREMAERTGLAIKPVQSAHEAVDGVDFYVTCLPNVAVPVVQAKWVKQKGVTVYNIGCYENESVLLKRMNRVIADMWEQGKHRGVQTHAIAVRDGIIPESLIEDFAPVVVGKRPGRQSKDENIFFNPTGLGFEDAIVAWRVYKEAKKRGTGTWITLWKSTKWI